MSFLQPILLAALPLALLPIVIHLINQHRHRTVQWAAMMFLLDAKKMTKGFARIRQILILAMRVLAVILLLFAASRPLAGGWLALTGGKASTIIVLLDRSASMEQQNLETGISKRSAALTKLVDLLGKTGKGSEIVLIDSATLTPTTVEDIASLPDLPITSPTATSADIPNLLQAALDFIAKDNSGRTDIWLASDLRQSDWLPGDGKWQALRTDFAALENTRLFLLNFPSIREGNYSVAVDNVQRKRASEGLQLVMDLKIQRDTRDSDSETTIPVEFTVNGTRTVQEMTISGEQLVRLGYTVPLGNSDARGWARFDLPADDNKMDNHAYLVFDEPAAKLTTIVSDDTNVGKTIRAAVSSPVESNFTYEAKVFTTKQTAQIPWEESAMVIWNAPLPSPDSNDSALLTQHIESGRTLILLPPENVSSEPNSFLGIEWEDWIEPDSQSLELGWWRTDSDLLENTRSGDPLPVNELKLFRTRFFQGEVQPLLKLASGESVIARVFGEDAAPNQGAVYIWGTLPRADHSTFASEGITFFVMLHRALDQGAASVSKARGIACGDGVLPQSLEWEILDNTETGNSTVSPELLPGAFELRNTSGTTSLLSLNRPVSEDDVRTLSEENLSGLLEGIEYRSIADEVDSNSSLASEIWRIFLIAMALALLAEAALCLPPRIEEKKESTPLAST